MAIATQGVKVRFAGTELDLSTGELIREGHVSRLQNQPLSVLRVLIDHAGRVVSREELQRDLWPNDTHGDFDHGLNKAIAKLRDALNDSKSTSRIIQTIPRHGYRLAAAVTWLETETPPQAETESLTTDSLTPGRRVSIFPLVASLLVLTALGTVLALNRTALRTWFGSPPAIHSVAVLPLQNLSGDPEQDYFAAGMTDELTTDLSYTKSLRVVPQLSGSQQKQPYLSVSGTAAQLHVDAIIEGTVLRMEDTVRITIRLIAAQPERQLWAASYERPLRDLLALQKQIAADASAQMRPELAPNEEPRIGFEGRINPEAYDEYLRGRFFLAQESGKGKAIPHLEHAIQLDGSFASAYAALGEAWAMQGVWGNQSTRQMSEKALEYSVRAVRLDPNSSEAYAALGYSLMQCRRWNEGEVALRRAIELDRANSNAKQYLALLLMQKNRMDEGLQLSLEIATANPTSINFQGLYALALYRAGRYADAVTQCQRVLELDPDYSVIYSTLANALAEQGRYKEAETAFKAGDFMDPSVEAWLDFREGNRQRADQLLKQNAGLVTVHAAVTHYLMGEEDLGMAELDDLANRKWAVKTYFLLNDPTFNPMRHDARFEATVRKTGLLDK